MVSERGTSNGAPLQDFILWNKNLVGTVYGSCNPRVDVTRLARLYQTGQLQLDEMITKRYRLDDINGALQAANVPGHYNQGRKAKATT